MNARRATDTRSEKTMTKSSTCARLPRRRRRHRTRRRTRYLRLPPLGYWEIGRLIDSTWPGNGETFEARVAFYYLANEHKRNGYCKIVYIAVLAYEILDLEKIKRQRKPILLREIPQGSHLYLVGQAGFVNISPTDSEAEKAAKFVYVIDVKFETVGHLTVCYFFGICRWRSRIQTYAKRILPP